MISKIKNFLSNITDCHCRNCEKIDYLNKKRDEVNIVTEFIINTDIAGLTEHMKNNSIDKSDWVNCSFGGGMGELTGALDIACIHGNVEIVKYLLSFDNLRIGPWDYNGNTPFMHAVNKNHVEIVSLFLKRKDVLPHRKNDCNEDAFELSERLKYFNIQYLLAIWDIDRMEKLRKMAVKAYNNIPIEREILCEPLSEESISE